MADHSAGDLIAWSPVVRQRLNEKYSFVHPENPGINRLSHMLWTGTPTRSARPMRATPSSTATRPSTARPAAPAPRRAWRSFTPRARLKAGDSFVHESIIGSLFKGRVESETTVGGKPAIIPSIGGWARMTGLNTIFIDDRDPFAHGFVVK